MAPDHPAHPVDDSSTTVQNEPRSDQPAVPTAAMPLMSRLSPTLCEFARPLSYAGRQAAAVIGRGGPESGSDSSLGSVSAGQTDSGVHPDSIPCGAAPHGGPVSAGTPTPVVLALAAGVEDGFDDEPGVLAGIARTFLSVAIVFAMTMGLWTASRSPVPRPGSNQPAVAGAVAFPGSAAHSSAGPSGRYRTKPIGEIRTGERVLAANPQMDHAVVTASEIDPATWRNIRLRMRKQHGGTLEIVLLRPLAWLAEQVDEFEQLAAADFHTSVPPHAVREGRDRTGWQLDSDVGQDTGWIHLALPELGAVGPAEVLAIEPCPPLASGPGRTVTGTFAHSAADVLDLEIEGLDAPLGCTANHPFWSADRQDFVPAGSLTIGEHLRTESGTLRQVTRITPRRGPPVAVFNLEVDAEHVYYVSTAGVLVHNAYPGDVPSRASLRIEYEAGWNRRDFNRKTRALQDLAERGKLRKAPNPVARDPSIPRNYKDALIRRAYDRYGKSDPAKFQSLRARIRQMPPDHVHELQLSDLDEASNLSLLDADVNTGIGRQMWQQIRNLPDGTIIDRIDVGGF